MDVEKARLLRPDLILMDIAMPGTVDGINAAETRLREFIEDSCSLLETSDKYIALRFLFDFSYSHILGFER